MFHTINTTCTAVRRTRVRNNKIATQLVVPHVNVDHNTATELARGRECSCFIDTHEREELAAAS